MTREEALELVNSNRNKCQVTTDKLLNNGCYVFCDRYGYLMYSNGEEILDENELEDDNWFECSDISFDSDYDDMISDYYD